MSAIFKQSEYERLRGVIYRFVELDIVEALIRHPQYVLEVSEFLADAIRFREDQEHNYKTEFAVACEDLRNGSEKKPAETTIAQNAAFADDVVSARVMLDDAKRDVAYWGGLLAAINSAGSSLKRLAELTISGWLAPNSADLNKADMARARQSEANSRRGSRSAD